MFYPTCYVYKIGVTDSMSTTASDNVSTSKKRDLSMNNKRSKVRATIINTPSSSIPVSNKIETSLIKKFANNLLISAQRTNCIDLEKT